MRNNTENNGDIRKNKPKIYSNLGLKLLSVVLGFLVWLLVLNIDDSADHKQHSCNACQYRCHHKPESVIYHNIR